MKIKMMQSKMRKCLVAEFSRHYGFAPASSSIKFHLIDNEDLTAYFTIHRRFYACRFIFSASGRDLAAMFVWFGGEDPNFHLDSDTCIFRSGMIYRYADFMCCTGRKSGE